MFTSSYLVNSVTDVIQSYLHSHLPGLPPPSFLSREGKILAASISGNIKERGLDSHIPSLCGKLLSSIYIDCDV